MIHPHLQDTSWVADRLPRLLPMHLSCAYMDVKRLPEWDTLVRVRNVLLGRDAKAIQVLAPTSEHITIHDFCLHLWHCVDGDPLPDFTHGGQGL